MFMVTMFGHELLFDCAHVWESEICAMTDGWQTRMHLCGQPGDVQTEAIGVTMEMWHRMLSTCILDKAFMC